MLARFYELKTNRPLYVTKGTQIQAKGLGSLRPDGYELSYSDAFVIGHYAVVVSGAKLPEIRREYEHVAAAPAASLRRPEKLHGLSPWSSERRAKKPEAAAVARIIGSMDERGAWTEEGEIGKADRVVMVTAAKDMVLTVNGKPMPIRENDRVELFMGSLPPRTLIIRTATFVKNLEAMAAYVAGDAKP